MRSLITLFTLLFLGTQMEAQITIERSDFNLESGMRVVGWNLDYSNANLPEEGEGLVWDYSDLLLTDTLASDYSTPSNALFPEANLTDMASRQALGGVGNQPGNSYYLLDDTGHGPIGEVYGALDVPLVTFTGGAEDVLKILETEHDFMERKSTIQFPLNFSDSWAYDITTETDYLVTVSAFSLQNTPAGQMTRDSAFCSVVGHGTLILPNPDGSGSVSMEALMLKRTRAITFNYTLGGQPAPQIMLDLFGLQQGEVQNLTRYFFYAKGLPRSAANIRVNAQGDIDFFTISEEIKNLITSSSEAEAVTFSTKVFPNPVRAGEMLSVEIPEGLQKGSIELLDMSGRVVFSTQIGAGQSTAAVLSLPVQLPGGSYIYRISDTNKEVRGIGKLQIIR
ncbi:MAG: T9SS type A sorting domain-containing protein [Phaeodactylibacter sp.]|uniref:T9SS type A sorting domain-containing protein n=1 Tax=Phaeodactylibacter sp. TaxID=1940289 RepID=UPI0032ED3865